MKLKGGGEKKQAKKPKTKSDSCAKPKAATSSGGKNKYPTFQLLGLPDDFTHFPNQCTRKDEVKRVLASAKSQITMMAVGFDGIDLRDSICMMQCSTFGRDGLISKHVGAIDLGGSMHVKGCDR